VKKGVSQLSTAYIPAATDLSNNLAVTAFTSLPFRLYDHIEITFNQATVEGILTKK